MPPLRFPQPLVSCRLGSEAVGSQNPRRCPLNDTYWFYALAFFSAALILQTVPGLENPPGDGRANTQEQEDHSNADSNRNVGDFIEAPTETADQV